MRYCLSDHMPQVKENCIEAIRALEGEWDIEIEEHKKPKTNSQRGTFHWLCGLFGEEIGLALGQVKELVKGQIFGWKHVKIGGVSFPIADGSSEELDRLGYATLIDTLYQIAAESGVRLPEPDPLRRASGK